MSAFSGENLSERPTTFTDESGAQQIHPLTTWYDGPTLLESIDSFKEPLRLINKPLRAVITGILSEGKLGCELSVKVLQGRVVQGRGIGLGQYLHRSAEDSLVSDTAVCSGDGRTEAHIADRFASSSTSTRQEEAAVQYAADVKKITRADGSTADVVLAGEDCNVVLVDRHGRTGAMMSLTEGMVLFKGPPLLHFRSEVIQKSEVFS